MEANDGRVWARRTETERRDAAVACLVRYFGARAARPVEYLERDWMAEEYSRGCYGAHFTPGVWTAFGSALRAPIGPIHWAGAECAEVWNGYMEGAVRSGEQVADDIMASTGTLTQERHSTMTDRTAGPDTHRARRARRGRGAGRCACGRRRPSGRWRTSRSRAAGSTAN